MDDADKYKHLKETLKIIFEKQLTEYRISKKESEATKLAGSWDSFLAGCLHAAEKLENELNTMLNGHPFYEEN